MPDDGLRIDLPAALAERVRAAAAARGESVETYLGRALQALVDQESADADALTDLDQRWSAVEGGEKTAAHDAVVEWLRTWGTPQFRSWRSR